MLMYNADMGTKTKKSVSTKHHKQLIKNRLLHFIPRWLVWAGSLLLIIFVGIYIAFQVSPWPSALLIRHEFNKGGVKTAAALEKYVPENIDSQRNVHYKTDDKDAFLDVYYPHAAATQNQQLPTVVWVHGGAWISGNKNNIGNYLKILANHNYTTVSVNYSIAPEKKYPTPIIQTNEALDYLSKHAKDLHINPNMFVMAGDSAGSQVVAQMANIITSPAYAKAINIAPLIQPHQLKAMVLNCGAYDLALPDYNGEFGKFLKTVLWSYSGTKDFLSDPKLKEASVANYLTPNFPPSFITAGNDDPLEPQSKELADRLMKLGVTVDPLFYPADHQPKLPHEYQFNLDNNDGKQALDHILAFLQKYTKTEE